MNKARLLTLAAFLNDIPAKHFNLDTYCNPNGYSANGWSNLWEQGSSFVEQFRKLLHLNFVNKMTQIADYKQEADCGTTACAVGWCPKAFPEDFEWNERSDSVRLIENKNTLNMDAAMEFFNLTEDAANYLFMPESYPKDKRGPKNVASRIKNVVKNRKFPKKYKSYER